MSSTNSHEGGPSYQYLKAELFEEESNKGYQEGATREDTGKAESFICLQPSAEMEEELSHFVQRRKDKQFEEEEWKTGLGNVAVTVTTVVGEKLDWMEFKKSRWRQLLRGILLHKGPEKWSGTVVG